MKTKFSAEKTLSGLKDFQRKTVEYVFQRMFDKINPARRFLVADEVGLGKTLVAKGLIAKTIEHLQDKTKRVDIIYVCSNADIATQNITRLMLPGLPSYSQATRLTLLPLVAHELRKNEINFVSFTPGTTFNQGNRTGKKEERRLIYQMLKGMTGIDSIGLRNSLQGAAGDGWFVEAESSLEFDQEIAKAFRDKVLANEKLLANVAIVCERFRDRRSNRTVSPEDRNACLEMISALRRQLAKTCLSALKPDLVILDEFQRFSELLVDPNKNPEVENPSAELAHELFNYSDDLKVLLLSATPYKMYASDADAEDHYSDFIKTTEFLLSDASRVSALTNELSQFRTGLLGARSETDLRALDQTKRNIEAVLKKVMCRTERVGTTLSGDAMVKEIEMTPVLKARDLHELRMIEEVGKALGEGESIEYWKSSPYLLNFMGDYKLKQVLREKAKYKVTALCNILEGQKNSLLKHSVIEKYRPLDPGNARMRSLLSEVENSGIGKLLWMPPSLPYWQPAGAYLNATNVRKQLIFSAWNVVPDAISSVLSYAVERSIVNQPGKKSSYSRMPKRFAPRLVFSGKTDAKLTGMTTLLLMFPSISLATLISPLALLDGAVVLPTKMEMLRKVTDLLMPIFEPFIDRKVKSGPFDRRWYWVALARLEASKSNDALKIWCLKRWGSARRNLAAEDGETSDAFQSHVLHWIEAWDGKLEGLGRVPDDLIEVLSNLALSGPAVCALRTTLSRWTMNTETQSQLLDASVHIAEGFRSQFNSPTSIALLKSIDEDSYWQQVLQYCVDGNLQSLLDEYAHTLFESKNLGNLPTEKALIKLAESMFEAMSLRTTTLRPDELKTEAGRLQIEAFPMRCHFALRFGDMNEEAGAVARKENVLASFNSPFRPFVLASTSVGQEGLDFHTWCHSIIHWNLPSNPVDMEQREGRVHRYKGHAVRKNIATRYGNTLFNQPSTAHPDPWVNLFEIAKSERPQAASDLVPYWIFEIEGGAKIERCIMSLPFSRDETRYRRLRKSLSLYRMVFAQPRQEDLLNYLTEVFGDERAPDIAARWRICLEPQ
jgi:hypothetical protein